MHLEGVCLPVILTLQQWHKNILQRCRRKECWVCFCLEKQQPGPCISSGGRTEEDEPAWCQWGLWPLTWPPPLQRSLQGLLTWERRPAHALHSQRHLTHPPTQQWWACMERIEGLYGCHVRGPHVLAATAENSWLYLSTYSPDKVYISAVFRCEWIKSALINLFGLSHLIIKFSKDGTQSGCWRKFCMNTKILKSCNQMRNSINR